MNTGLSVLTSGLAFQKRRLDVSANNVANATTEGFQPSRVVASPRRDGGVSAVVQPQSPPGMDSAALFSTTDLVTEAVTQMTAVHAYQAQVSALRTQDETLRTLTHTV